MRMTIPESLGSTPGNMTGGRPGLRLVGAAAIAVLLHGTRVTPVLAADPAQVRFAAGDLAVEASGAPLDELLAAIAAATGARLEGRPAGAPERVTASLPPTPLDAALARLFPSASVAVSWRTGGRPTRIRWVGASDSPGLPRGMAPPVARGLPPAPAEPARAAEQEGADAPRDGAQPHEIAAYLRTSRHLRRLVATRMKGLDDAQALAALEAVAGDRTEGLLRAVAADRRLGKIARRADRILEREIGR